MNEHLEHRLQCVVNALNVWLDGYQRPGSPLQRAMEKTAEQGLFPIQDIRFGVEHLCNTVLNGEPESWLRAVLADGFRDNRSETVLCLHAGNLPLVGFQDVLAVLLSGAGYAGKLSRKDPWLIASFLECLRTLDASIPIETTLDLATYEGRQFKRWMFAGSDDGLLRVSAALQNMGVLHKDAQALLRTAHFSAAYLSEWSDAHIEDLIESILRYDGKGCRSVAIIYAPIPLEKVAASLQKAGAQWLERNRFDGSSAPIVGFRAAYNAAVGIPSVLVGTQLIQEGVASPDHPEIVYWQRIKDVHEPRLAYGKALQEVYGDAGAPLHEAQRPPISWRPDGSDPLAWLLGVNG
ncbi:MAG: hypothetical protein JJU41_00710 [Bacteroidetes bacterium]|nr:hypothetical protein [Bacteroidota bacterium]